MYTCTLKITNPEKSTQKLVYGKMGETCGEVTNNTNCTVKAYFTSDVKTCGPGQKCSGITSTTSERGLTSFSVE